MVQTAGYLSPSPHPAQHATSLFCCSLGTRLNSQRLHFPELLAVEWDQVLLGRTWAHVMDVMPAISRPVAIGLTVGLGLLCLHPPCFFYWLNLDLLVTQLQPWEQRLGCGEAKWKHSACLNSVWNRTGPQIWTAHCWRVLREREWERASNLCILKTTVGSLCCSSLALIQGMHWNISPLKKITKKKNLKAKVEIICD